LFSLLFSLFSFCLPLTAMWWYPSRCLLPSARSLARLICVAVQRRHPHKRRDARTLSLLVLFFCVAASRKVSRPNPRCQNLRSQTHVLIHALRLLRLKLTSWSMLSESYVSTNPRPIPCCQNLTSQNPRADPCWQNLMSKQIQVLFHTVRIFGSQTHMLIHAAQNRRSQSHVLIHTIRILGLKPMS
jgi:hypothetical protein